MVISPASSPNSHLRDEDLGDVFAVCSANHGKRRKWKEIEERGKHVTLLN